MRPVVVYEMYLPTITESRKEQPMNYIIAAIVGLLVGGVVCFPLGYRYRIKKHEEEISEAQEDATRILNEAYKSAESKKRELLLEAKEADAVDIDPNAINIAYENSDMNDIPREKYHVCAGNILEDTELHQKYSGKKYDMVEANIVADIIIALTKQVPDYIKDGGIFLSSGIITERKEDVLAALEAGNFKVEAIREKNGWVAIASRFQG